MSRLYSVRSNLNQDEPLAEDGSTAEGNEVNEEADEDGLTPIVLEARYEREIPVNSWFV